MPTSLLPSQALRAPLEPYRIPPWVWAWLGPATKHARSPCSPARCRMRSAGEAGWEGGVMKSWQIGADCPIIVDNKAFQQGHKSMTDGDTVGGGYRLIFPPCLLPCREERLRRQRCRGGCAQLSPSFPPRSFPWCVGEMLTGGVHPWSLLPVLPCPSPAGYCPWTWGRIRAGSSSGQSHISVPPAKHLCPASLPLCQTKCQKCQERGIFLPA